MRWKKPPRPFPRCPLPGLKGGEGAIDPRSLLERSFSSEGEENRRTSSLSLSSLCVLRVVYVQQPRLALPQPRYDSHSQSSHASMIPVTLQLWPRATCPCPPPITTYSPPSLFYPSNTILLLPCLQFYSVPPSLPPSLAASAQPLPDPSKHISLGA